MKMADIINKFYKKIANNGNDSDYELVGEIGVDGMPLEDYVSNQITDLKEYITSQMESILDSFYPVGSIYFSVKNENPSSKFGGTWVAWGSGRVPVGVNSNDGNFNSVEKTGGTSTHSHSITIANKAAFTSGSTALTVSQMPSHTHSGTTKPAYTVLMRVVNQVGSEVLSNYISGSNTAASYVDRKGEGSFPGSSHFHDFTTTATGGGGGHTHSIPAHAHTASSGSVSTLQPYITCYMWKRTA